MDLLYYQGKHGEHETWSSSANRFAVPILLSRSVPLLTIAPHFLDQSGTWRTPPTATLSQFFVLAIHTDRRRACPPYNSMDHIHEVQFFTSIIEMKIHKFLCKDIQPASIRGRYCIWSFCSSIHKTRVPALRGLQAMEEIRLLEWRRSPPRDTSSAGINKRME